MVVLLKFVNIMLYGFIAVLGFVFLAYILAFNLTVGVLILIFFICGLAVVAYFLLDKHENKGLEDIIYATNACEKYWKTLMKNHNESIRSENIKYSGISSERQLYFRKGTNLKDDCQSFLFFKGDVAQSMILMIYSFTKGGVVKVKDDIKNEEEGERIFKAYNPFNDGGDSRTYHSGQQINISTDHPKKKYDAVDDDDKQTGEKSVSGDT